MFCFQGECGTIYVIDCESPYDVIRTPGTSIISPNYPGYYDKNLLCEVTISFEGRVSIEFEYLDLQPTYTDHCDDDWLEVRDGESSDSEMIGDKICGEEIPQSIESTGNSITLVFHSDDSWEQTGFRILSDLV